ncbi:hypothetical protein [Humibacter ginsengiterrae]
MSDAEHLAGCDFSMPLLPRPGGSTPFLFDGRTFDWNAIRDAGLSPRALSDLGESEDDRREFLHGCELLRLKKIHPQQLLVADVLSADGVNAAAFLLPRRSSKSTSLIALSLGRAANRDDYRVGILTMTSGKAGRSRFAKDVVPVLERAYPEKDERPFKIVKSAGQERVEWPAGSFVQWLSSVNDLRGEAFDLVILDEAGEPDPGKVEDTLAAALPTMDTRPGSQIIVAGTAGVYRRGNLLWDWLERGRSGSIGIIDYSIADELTVEDIPDWGAVEPYVRHVHPGVDTLTTIESVQRNFESMPPDRFLREYLGVFGDEGGSPGVIRPQKWNACELAEGQPEPPKKFSLGVSATISQGSAAIVAAWRDDDGKARLLLLKHRPGVAWLAGEAVQLAAKYRAPIAHDTLGVIVPEVEAMKTMQPRPRFAPMGTRDVTAASAALVREVDTGNLGHWRQSELSGAALRAKKRKVGVNGFAFGRAKPDDDIAAIEAAALALRAYDTEAGRVSFVPFAA